MPTSNLDDILIGAATNTAPATPEHQPEVETDVSRETHDSYEQDDKSSSDIAEKNVESSFDSPEKAEAAEETDDYGNRKTPPKSYTEDEVNERINRAVRERLERLERNNPQPTQQQVQQATNAGFEYDADSAQTWQQQLESFVEQTVSKMSQRQAQQAQQQQERMAQIEFEEKFQKGISRFGDFVDVVGKHASNITDAMTMALRGVADPSAFVYAAAKREPGELERISKLRDPVAQITEMGKLEERMKRNKPVTRTPKPIGKTASDINIPAKQPPREKSIEELIQEAANRKLALQRQKTNR